MSSIGNMYDKTICTSTNTTLLFTFGKHVLQGKILNLCWHPLDDHRQDCDSSSFCENSQKDSSIQLLLDPGFLAAFGSQIVRGHN